MDLNFVPKLPQKMNFAMRLRLIRTKGLAGLHNLLKNEFTTESLLWLLLYKRETDSGTLKKCYTRS